MIIIEIDDEGNITNVFADAHGEAVLYISWHGSDGVGQPRVSTGQVQPVRRVPEAFVAPCDRE